MGVHIVPQETESYRANVIGRMARDRSGSDYSENMSDATTCSCTTSSVVDKFQCSSRGCCAFQEPFFLHPPGSRPRDGIYVNPMSAYIADLPKPKDAAAESFYLHSPQDLVYTRITRLFADTEKQRAIERKDETLTVKVDVHVNNGIPERSSSGNGYAARSEAVRDPSEHAYEQICPRQEEPGIVAASAQKKISDNASDCSRSRKADRRYSRSSSASESSNMSSEIPCFSSSTSTPSLSRNSSNERIGKNGKVNPEAPHGSFEGGGAYRERSSREPGGCLSETAVQFLEKKDSPVSQAENEKEPKPAVNAASLAKPPPPPPPPPPPDRDDVLVLVVNAKQSPEVLGRDEKKEAANEADRDGRKENGEDDATTATNKSDASCGEHRQPEVPPASPPADTEEIKASQASHLVNRHMVLPFIPPKFANADSNTLLKPSEYLKSICKTPSRNSLSKARSVDNLDIQGRSAEREESVDVEGKEAPPGPPPPPLLPLQKARPSQEAGLATDSEVTRTPQPLATISIQDLTSIQLRRTSTKMNATKTFSAPPPRSVSMTNVSEPFFVQKTDLIAELKRTKDIPGIKKLKVERAQVEKTQERNLMSEISKAFNASNFVDQIPEKDSSGNAIPIWKRQMLARKAAERAKKELEEQIAKENEERRQKAIPPWKRQLLAKKDTEEKRLIQPLGNAKIESSSSPKRELSPAPRPHRNDERFEAEDKRNDAKEDSDDAAQIIPWRAHLRKTNSKLNILE